MLCNSITRRLLLFPISLQPYYFCARFQLFQQRFQSRAGIGLIAEVRNEYGFSADIRFQGRSRSRLLDKELRRLIQIERGISGGNREPHVFTMP